MNLNERMKLYEQQETGRRCLPLLPVIARLDGRSFHSFTKGLDRPFDTRLSNLMVEVTKFLVEETNACIGYTQSDEISLVFYSGDIGSQIYFDAKMFKMVSILAALTSVIFNKYLPLCLPEKSDCTPVFDCRVWSVPSKEEAVNALIWREQDATRNSISMASQSYYSHKQLHDMSTATMLDMLLQKDVNWHDYPAYFKRGVYVQRHKVVRKFPADELDKLPLKHNARLNPDLEVERMEVRILDMLPLVHAENRVEIVFYGDTPLLKTE